MDAVLTLERRDLLRQAALERRNALSKAEVYLWSEQIQARALALDFYRAADTIAIYSPIQNEVDTGRLIDHALASGKRVFLPRWLGREFGFGQITARSQLVAGRLGILEPTGATGLAGADNQNFLVFVPGLVFDARGNRLGRGAGYYDRLLGRFCGSARIAGLAYEFQIVEAVPAQEWDYRMHFIVTEERTIDCGLSLRQARSMGN
ncbi:MAG TPA: 5-formyltetrahydrofolate cyclo-ligase [Candidatus Binatia bacterium]